MRKRSLLLAAALMAPALMALACFSEAPPADRSTGQAGGPLAIAAASDLRYALDDVVTAFRQTHPDVSVTVTYGASGSFYAQLLNGAPFDLYLSADLDYAKQLGNKGIADSRTLFTYAEGRLVLWVTAGSSIDIDGRGLNVLTDASVTRVSIANPQHAPYGRAAEAALRSAGIYDAVKPKLVLGENVSQALQFAETGAAQVGIVALSLALAPPVAASGRYAIVPADAHPRLDQGGVVIKGSKGEASARVFRAFMQDAGGRAVLERYGFATPD